jgi:hypothetical protein
MEFLFQMLGNQYELRDIFFTHVFHQLDLEIEGRRRDDPGS